MNPPEPMECTVYKCAREAETRLFFASGTGQSTLPATPPATPGAREEVIGLDLDPGWVLARVDASGRLARSRFRRFNRQIPPTAEPGTERIA